MKEKLFEIAALVETSVDDVNGLDVELAIQKLLQNEVEISNQNFSSVQEKEFIITCSTVFRSSLAFWNDYVKENYVGKRPWWNIVLNIALADATGVGIGFLLTGNWIAGGILGAAVSYRVGEVLINE